jgi:hypothetical protein
MIGIALSIVTIQMLVELGIKNPLGQRLLQLVDQPILIEGTILPSGRLGARSGVKRAKPRLRRCRNAGEGREPGRPCLEVRAGMGVAGAA